MPVDSPPWSLTIPSDLRLLALSRAFVEAVCQVAGLDERATHAVVLATDEAINNVMRHAHRDRPEATVQLQCFLGEDRVEIRLHDEGDPFDLAAVPHLNPAELRIGGRGVFLMRRLMDEITVEPRGNHGNTLRMVKLVSTPSAPSASPASQAQQVSHSPPARRSAPRRPNSCNRGSPGVDTESRTGPVGSRTLLTGSGPRPPAAGGAARSNPS
ncbi:MAG: ATP-binding protein [Gemmataceae bacterium]